MSLRGTHTPISSIKASTENEHTSSQGNASTSQRRNSSQHNTNRSNTAIQSSGASRTLNRLNEQVTNHHQSSCKEAPNHK